MEAVQQRAGIEAEELGIAANVPERVDALILKQTELAHRDTQRIRGLVKGQAALKASVPQG